MTNKQLTIAQLLITVLLGLTGWQGYNTSNQLKAMQDSHAQAKAEIVQSVKEFVKSKLDQK